MRPFVILPLLLSFLSVAHAGEDRGATVAAVLDRHFLRVF